MLRTMLRKRLVYTTTTTATRTSRAPTTRTSRGAYCSSNFDVGATTWSSIGGSREYLQKCNFPTQMRNVRRFLCTETPNHVGAKSQNTSVTVSFAGPSSHAGVPVLVEFVSEENALDLSQVWSKSISTDFSGKEGSTLLYYTYSDDQQKPQRVLWVGIGKESKVTLHTLRQATSTAVDKILELKLTDATFSLDMQYFSDINGKLEYNSLLSTMTSTILQSNYYFGRHITVKEKIKTCLQNVALTIKPSKNQVQLNELNKAIQLGYTLGEATNFARDLANERPDVCTPQWMENEATKLVRKYDNNPQHDRQNPFTLEVVDEHEMEKLGMNLFYSVGKGSRTPPRLVIVSYRGDPNKKDTVALVGKGITFDTGGLNLKPTGSIEDMYLDMSGSAAVLAVMAALPKLDLKLNVVGALCLAENAIGSGAYHPSSILKSYKGLTVEIGNTDAEGRLVLADSLTYVQKKFEPSHVIDIATLTGACVVALGEYASGLFTNDDDLKQHLLDAADVVFERTWPLPLYPEYSSEIKGSQSDLKNVGKGRYGGASTAAAFLKEFIEEKVCWAHLDVAGPAMTTEKRGHIPKGGTGYGAQLLLQWLISKSKK